MTNWAPNPGPQTAALARQEREILYGGARGGGKTEAGIIWIAAPAIMRSGRSWRYPYYRGLVVRKHVEDMKDWLDRADKFYLVMGARRVGRPPEYRFPGGAIVRVGHLRDEESYAKYLGHEYQRILIEELTQVPTEQAYMNLLGSLRSKYRDLPEQVFLTSNPGGPGMNWVRRRFIMGDDGRQRSPGVPFQGEDGNWRIYIPATVDDNPYISKNNPAYIAYLESLPEPLRSAWRHGDWSCFMGQFFSEFRPSGPQGAEESERYPWAVHVVAPVRLEPWWHRWMSCDWGYEHPAVAHWYVQLPTGQVHVYRELTVRRQGARVLGRRIAEESEPDLAGGRSMMLHLSPDAFRRTDEGKTIAEQIAEGVCEALGEGAGSLDVDGKARIVLRLASNARIAGWMTIREMLRFIPAFPGEAPLPKLQIWDCCCRLIDTLQIMVFDTGGANPEDCVKMNAVDGKGGDDAADSLRYGMMAWRARHTDVPLSMYVASKVSDVASGYPEGIDPTVAYMVAAKAEQDYLHKKRQAAPVTFRRAARLREGTYGKHGTRESEAGAVVYGGLRPASSSSEARV